MGLFQLLAKLFAPPRLARRHLPPTPEHDPAPGLVEVASPWLSPREPLRRAEEQAGQRVLKGRCWVIDGDTIVIDRTHIRLAGIDAPELDHPYGQNAKRALMQLCRERVVTW